MNIFAGSKLLGIMVFLLLFSGTVAIPSFSEEQTTGFYIANDYDYLPKICFVNLWKKPVDIQYGDDPNFSIKGLKPFTPSVLMSVQNCDRPGLYFKASTDENWMPLVDANGSPIEVKLKPWSVQIVRISSAGTVDIVPLVRTRAGVAHCAFVNASGKTLDDMALVDSGFVTQLQVSQIPNQAVTSFAEIQAGNYGAFWTHRNASAYSNGTKGTLGLVSFSVDSWYLVVANPSTAATDPVKIWSIGLGEPILSYD